MVARDSQNSGQNERLEDGSPPLTEEQVVRYLSGNPEFCERYRSYLGIRSGGDSEVPERQLGDNVSDLQSIMVRYLREELRHAEQVHKNLQRTARDNLRDFRSVFDIVLEMMRASSFEELLYCIREVLPRTFGISAASLAMEVAGQDDVTVIPGLRPLPQGFIDEAMGDQAIALCSNSFGNGHIFGTHATLIGSYALLRIRLDSDIPDVLLAFGSSQSSGFHEDQATDVVGFIAQVVEQMLRLWLNFADQQG